MHVASSLLRRPHRLPTSAGLLKSPIPASRYPHPSPDRVPRQVFDAEHLISAIRRDSSQEYLRVPEEPLGFWSLRANDQGHVLVTHLREPTQLLVSHPPAPARPAAGETPPPPRRRRRSLPNPRRRRRLSPRPRRRRPGRPTGPSRGRSRHRRLDASGRRRATQARRARGGAGSGCRRRLRRRLLRRPAWRLRGRRRTLSPGSRGRARACARPGGDGGWLQGCTRTRLNRGWGSKSMPEKRWRSCGCQHLRTGGSSGLAHERNGRTGFRWKSGPQIPSNLLSFESEFSKIMRRLSKFRRFEILTDEISSNISLLGNPRASLGRKRVPLRAHFSPGFNK